MNVPQKEGPPSPRKLSGYYAGLSRWNVPDRPGSWRRSEQSVSRSPKEHRVQPTSSEKTAIVSGGVFVVDASVVVEFLAPGRSGEAADRFIGGLAWPSPLELLAPDLLLLEVANALRKLALIKSISDAAADRAVNRLPEIGIAAIAPGPLLADAWTLRSKLTIYDALYVALAKNLDIPLVTADVRLSRAMKGTGAKAWVVDDPVFTARLDAMER